MLRLEDIRIYPVKGLRGFSVGEAEVEPWGLAGDRRWMVVGLDRRFVSQRQASRMALVDAAPHGRGLRLAAEGFGVLEIAVPDAEAPALEVSVWRDTVRARAAGSDADAWLSQVLGMACQLVHMSDPATARPVDPAFAGAGDRVSFADGFPLLVTNAASLADLNTRLARPVPMDRFRTNLMVGGAAAWAEDRWRGLRIGDVAFAAPKDCDRCVVTTVDQHSGRKSEEGEPLRTLGTFRRNARGRIIFGQNLIPGGRGRIAVGAQVEVLA